eukprot:gene819-66194_t
MGDEEAAPAAEKGDGPPPATAAGCGHVLGWVLGVGPCSLCLRLSLVHPAPRASEYKLRSIGDDGLGDLAKSTPISGAGMADVVLLIPAGAAKEVHLGQVTSVALPVVKPDVADVIPEWCEKLVGELVSAEDEKQHDKLFDVLMGAHALG